MPVSTVAGGGWHAPKQGVGEDGVRDRGGEFPDGLLNVLDVVHDPQVVVGVRRREPHPLRGGQESEVVMREPQIAGVDFVDLAEQLGLSLFEWQRWLVRWILAVDTKHRLLIREAKSANVIYRFSKLLEDEQPCSFGRYMTGFAQPADSVV